MTETNDTQDAEASFRIEQQPQQTQLNFICKNQIVLIRKITALEQTVVRMAEHMNVSEAFQFSKIKTLTDYDMIESRVIEDTIYRYNLVS